MELALDRPGLVTYAVSNFTATEEDIGSGNAGGSLQVAVLLCLVRVTSREAFRTDADPSTFNSS